MDKLTLKKAGAIWKEIGHYKKPEELHVEIEIYKKMLDLFQVGDYCYFIFSPPEMQMEYTNDSIYKLLGYTPEEFTLEIFLDIIHPDDLQTYLNFEATITEFWKNLPPDKVFKYKTRYDFRIRCKNGQTKRLLQQVAVIQSDEEGAVLRTFVVFTDISELKETNKMVLSIIGLDGEPCYIDIHPVKELVPYKSILTKREIQVFRLLVEGCQSAEIAEILNISLHTVSSHRKNILRKTKTNSVLHLTKLGLEKGWI
ncbi:LuxR C-terminal-related transcriptional regulator [Myroides indicus]|uniref:PAS domain-containing protein n=1 Tax=Myroides indicus TaxID=1323422 RepID=A0A4V3E8Q0_9FLAO|nr:LuxR C-terminal-related transcriptional regulator [Myroides indicus]TDS60209.1 PAS domain-containing protein [Myroides indicus]